MGFHVSLGECNRAALWRMLGVLALGTKGWSWGKNCTLPGEFRA